VQAKCRAKDGGQRHAAANNLSETRPKSNSVDIAQVQIESCGARAYADGQILCVGLSYVHTCTVV
jgi:hypothetical protein